MANTQQHFEQIFADILIADFIEQRSIKRRRPNLLTAFVLAGFFAIAKQDEKPNAKQSSVNSE